MKVLAMFASTVRFGNIYAHFSLRCMRAWGQAMKRIQNAAAKGLPPARRKEIARTS